MPLDAKISPFFILHFTRRVYFETSCFSKTLACVHWCIVLLENRRVAIQREKYTIKRLVLFWGFFFLRWYEK
jgi:hypothetical protein